MLGSVDQNKLAWSGVFVVVVLVLMWWFQGLVLADWANWEMSSWLVLAGAGVAGWYAADADMVPKLVEMSDRARGEAAAAARYIDEQEDE